jgi:hypothetical protein
VIAMLTLSIGASHYLYHRDEIARLNGEWTAFLTPEGRGP